MGRRGAEAQSTQDSWVVLATRSALLYKHRCYIKIQLLWGRLQIYMHSAASGFCTDLTAAFVSLWVEEAFSSDRDLPAVVFLLLANASTGSSSRQHTSYPHIILLPFEAQLPLKMLANSHCLVTDNLCQDEICSNQSPPHPTPLQPVRPAFT